MATILAYTSPAVGHLFPLTPLLLELQRRGHRTHLRTLAARVPQMRDLGFAAAPIDPRIEAITMDDHRAKGPVKALGLAAEVFASRGTVDGPDLKRAMDTVNPDAVIVDTNCWGARTVAEKWGGPWIAFSPYIPALASRGTPPFGPGLAPMSGPLGALRDALVGRMVMGAIENALVPRINALRGNLGLGPVSGADDFQRRAPLTLVTTAKPFEYATTDWGSGVLMIGACAWEPPQDVPGWFHRIRKPIALVTTSSESQNDDILVRTALAALKDEPVHVVATMPAGLSADLEAPSNATVVEFVPHAPVLQRAAVAITHGGMGATQKALAHGVPVCVVPFGRDQFEVARRVEVSGAGTRLPRDSLTPSRLRAAVKRAMAMPDGARRVQAGFVAAGGPSAGADAVEARLLVRAAA